MLLALLLLLFTFPAPTHLGCQVQSIDTLKCDVESRVFDPNADLPVGFSDEDYRPFVIHVGPTHPWRPLLKQILPGSFVDVEVRNNELWLYGVRVEGRLRV